MHFQSVIFVSFVYLNLIGSDMSFLIDVLVSDSIN